MEQTEKSIKAKEYRATHKEQAAEYNKQWRAENQHLITKYSKKYYKENKNRINEYYKRWYAENKEGCAIKQKQYVLSNKKRLMVRNKEYRKKNKQKRLELNKKWRQTPKGKLVSKVQHCRRRSLESNLSLVTVQRVYEDNIKKHGTLTCILCNKPIEFGEDSLEHKTPLSRGGSNDYENLGIAHSLCNSKKRTRTMEEWQARKSLEV